MTTQKPQIRQLLGRLGVLLIVSFCILIASILGLSHVASQLAEESQKSLLPKIHEHQRAALNLERLERMGDLVAYGVDITMIRKNALAAQVLAYQPSFEFDPTIRETVRRSYEQIKQLRRTRQSLIRLQSKTASSPSPRLQQLIEQEKNLREQWDKQKLGLFELQNRIISKATQLQTQTLHKISLTHQKILLVGGSGVTILLLVLTAIIYQLVKHLIKPVQKASHALLAIERSEPYYLRPARYEETSTIFHAVDRLAINLRTLHDLATTDSLTNCLNRRYFVEQADEALNQAHEQHTDLALVMLDIDHFKKVNDLHGHATGDSTLKLFSQWIKEIIPSNARLGRLGGEEFALLLPEQNEQQASILADHIRSQIAERSANCPEIPPITVSMGVKGRTSPLDQLDSLLSKADKALYHAKTQGRNRVVTCAELTESTEEKTT